MSLSTQTVIHCSSYQPNRLELKLKTFDSFCSFEICLRGRPGELENNVSIFLPEFMAGRLANAVDVFNDAMGVKPEIIEAAPKELKP